MRWSGLAVVLLLAVAGCSDAPKAHGARGQGAGPSEPEDVLGLESTKTTGLLVGYVVDAALRPLGGVTVTMTRPGLEAQTASTGDGLWGFDGLDPGVYVVRANLTGYVGAQVVAEVAADIPDPDPVRLVLERDLETIPFAVATAFDGFLTCGARAGTGSQHCAITQTREALGDRSQALIDVDGVPEWIQAEMLWDSTQPLADELGMYFRQAPGPGSDADAYMGIYPLNMGPSPVLLAVNGTGHGLCHTCVEAPVNMTRWSVLQVDVRSGDLKATRPPETCAPTPSNTPCLAGVGVTLNQKFQLFVHVFYLAGPEAGWQFSVHGPPFR